MIDSDKVIRDIYTSDIILMEEEIEMMYGVDDSYFKQLEKIRQKIENHQVILLEDEFNDLEKSFDDFYFEYAYVQFKRGLELGLCLRNIH